MSTDGSSDWIVPLMWFNVIGLAVLLLVGVGAYRIHKQRVACEERGGVLVVAGDEHICVSKKAIID